MNPLLFADWARMNRLFTRVMWCVALVLIGVVLVAVIAPGTAPHAAAAAQAGAAGR